IASCYLASLALTFGTARARPVPDPSASPRAAVPGEVTARVRRPSRWRELVDGLVRVATTPELLAMMLLAFLVNLTAYPISGSLLPYVARSVFHADATGLGYLAASFALGGLVGSIVTVVM